MDTNFYAYFHIAYHISTLLQVSEIAKYQGDHAVSGDLLERALFNIGRSVHSSFATRLRQGKARTDFNVTENRELFLASWRYMLNLGMKGTWKTAYEWSKLILGLDTSDPYSIGLIIDQLAIRGRQLDHFIALCSSGMSRYGWENYPNIQCSLALALFLRGDAKGCREQLRDAMSRYPWVFCRLAQELNLSPVPKQIWGVEAPDGSHALFCELYIARAKDNWNTPEAISLMIEVADSVTRSKNSVEAPEITLSVARHVVLSDIRSVTTLLPRQFVAGRISVSDPLPPDQPPDAGRELPREILEAAWRAIGLPGGIPEQQPDDDGEITENHETTDDSETQASRIESYLFEEGLERLREFLHENGVDRGNWEPDYESNPVTDWIARLRRVPEERWHALINDAATDLDLPFIWELLMSELQSQTEHDALA